MNQAPALAQHFSSLSDPRVERSRLHSLHDILVIAICGIICGADDWVSIEDFGNAKLSWLRRFLELPNGVPSHDTFGRVFAALNPQEFSRCFAEWVASVAQLSNGEIVAIDGKTLRRSFDRASSKAAIHMVSAWATANHMVLGQIKTEEKSNEITAIPKLLQVLELSGCIVTIDAMGCQREIAKKIVDKNADYVLGLKGNQGHLFTDVEAYFSEALRLKFPGTPHDFWEEFEHVHGRVERRRAWCTPDLDWFEERHQWRGIRSIGMIEAERTVDGKTSTEKRYYISSLSGNDAKQFAHAVRMHWRIENCLHWVLDIAFREDDSRVRQDHAPENLAMLRHVATNLLKQEKTAKLGVKNKRLKAGWDEDYLLKILGF